MNIDIVVILVLSGILVGFINTLAGGGTIISLSLFMVLGLPASVANGTNRIAVILQNLTSVAEFKRKGYLDVKKATKFALPTMLGAVIGAQVASNIDENIFRTALGIIMIVMLVFVVYKPSKWLTDNQKLIDKPVSWWQSLLFLAIGFYGGFLQVGVGYFLLTTIVLSAGYNLVKANAIKVWIVLLYTPLSLVVFILHNQVDWGFGLVHAAGNVIGAYVASHFATAWGAKFVRWLLIVLIIIFSLDLLSIIDLSGFIKNLM